MVDGVFAPVAPHAAWAADDAGPVLGEVAGVAYARDADADPYFASSRFFGGEGSFVPACCRDLGRMMHAVAEVDKRGSVADRSPGPGVVGYRNSQPLLVVQADVKVKTGKVLVAEEEPGRCSHQDFAGYRPLITYLRASCRSI